MTLARTALRYAAVAALTGTKGHRPTIAGKRVFDSRIGDVDPTKDEDRLPILLIQTDGDEGDPTDMADGKSPSGGPPFWTYVDLIIEHGMVVREACEGGFVIGHPQTDAQMEAQLDFLEYQVMATLASDPSPAARAFRRVAKIMRRESHRQKTDEAGDRVAVRVTTLRCFVKFQCDVPSDPAAVGLERLPEPLRTVAKAIDPDTPAGKAVAQLAVAVTAADPLPAFEAIGMAFHVHRPPRLAPDVVADLLPPQE